MRRGVVVHLVSVVVSLAWVCGEQIAANDRIWTGKAEYLRVAKNVGSQERYVEGADVSSRVCGCRMVQLLSKACLEWGAEEVGG